MGSAEKKRGVVVLHESLTFGRSGAEMIGQVSRTSSAWALKRGKWCVGLRVEGVQRREECGMYTPAGVYLQVKL